MPTRRVHTTSLCTGTTLIVAGGVAGRVLSTVEVMDTKTHQWSTAADLPEPIWDTSATVCGDQLYLLGSLNDILNDTGIKSVYACSVNTLLQSCVPNSMKANSKGASLEDQARVWRQVTDLPVVQSTCESFHDRLLAIGGEVDSEGPTTAVYMYNSTTNSWEIISHMTTGRYRCFTAVLPNNELMVVGGRTDSDHFTYTETVEIACACN